MRLRTVRAIAAKRVARRAGRARGGPPLRASCAGAQSESQRGRVDDWDKSGSVVGNATPHRSSSDVRAMSRRSFTWFLGCSCLLPVIILATASSYPAQLSWFVRGLHVVVSSLYLVVPHLIFGVIRVKRDTDITSCRASRGHCIEYRARLRPDMDLAVGSVR